jgi:imidazolonepropionase-like amidohydrolase
MSVEGPAALTGLFALLVVTGSPAAATAPTTTSPFAIEHVTVIDVESGTRLRDHTAVVSGHHIDAVGPAARTRVPAGARRVDGHGKFLIPGLWDMHTHVCNDSATFRTALPLLLANGITGVRDMAGPLQQVIAWRDDTRAGKLLGPRAVVSGPLIDGPPPATDGDILATTPEEARRDVDSLAAAGVDFIKSYEMLRRDVFLAILDAARRRGLRVAGHLPMAVSAVEASNAGMASFEHLRNLELACSSKAESLMAARIDTLNANLDAPGRALRSRIQSTQRPVALDTEDPARRRALLETLARNRTWQVPTLYLDDVALAFSDSATMRRVRATEPYVSGEVSAWWEQQRTAFLGAPEPSQARARRHAEWQRAMVKSLRDARVGILAGSDMPNLITPAGFSLHEELRALQGAGLTPIEALRTATLAPAQYLGATDSLGSVAAGKVADLVLLDADPLADIGNVSRIRAVVVNGRLLTRADLDGLLAAAKREASASH